MSLFNVNKHCGCAAVSSADKCFIITVHSVRNKPHVCKDDLNKALIMLSPQVNQIYVKLLFSAH